MKKLIKTVLLVFLTLLLTGCGDAQINISIEPDFTSILEYKINLSTEDIDENYKIQIIRFFDQAAVPYKTYGFEYKKTMDDTSLQFIYTIKKSNGSYIDAYKQLNVWLTDPTISFFTEVSLYSKVESHEQLFSFEVKSDFDQVIQASSLSILPRKLQTQIIDAFNASVVTLNLTLPRSTAEENSEGITVEHSDLTSVYSKPLSLNSQDTFKVIARSSIEDGKLAEIDNQQYLDQFDSKVKNFEMLKLVSLSLAGVSILLFILNTINKKKS